MDYVTERQLRNQFENLDKALARNDRLAAQFAMDEINRLVASQAPAPRQAGMTDRLPGWVREIIENRGYRLKAVENALHVDRVVVSPTYSKGAAGVKLEFRF